MSRSNKRNNIIKFIKGVILISFLIVFVLNNYAIAFRYEAANKERTIDFSGFPIESGKIVRKYKLNGCKNPMVIIQDLHANMEVQENIKDILNYFSNNHGIEKIGIEGNTDKTDT
ncbi:MAG: hypothetical protein ACOC56_03115, partial [Atribacterota bacterium]